MDNLNKTNYFSDGSSVYYNIMVSGTPDDIEEGIYYGEVYYLHPKTGKKEVIWYCHVYSTSIGAFADCYEKMLEYIEEYPVVVI